MSKVEEKDTDGDADVVYVQPNVEIELPKEKRQVCRDIIMEIKNFGVNQRQILFLIQLLAMELENTEVMKAIVKTIGNVRKDIPAGNKLVVTTSNQLPPKKKPGLTIKP